MNKWSVLNKLPIVHTEKLNFKLLKIIYSYFIFCIIVLNGINYSIQNKLKLYNIHHKIFSKCYIVYYMNELCKFLKN